MTFERRTPLRRTGFARTSRKRIPYRSDKREAVAVERRLFVERILRERQWCEAHPVLRDLALVAGPLRAESVDVHELVRRSQGSPIVPSQGLTDDRVLALCRPCHDWVTTHPREAVSLGLARWGMRPNPGDDTL